jgi:hypothetical protein
VHFSERGTSIRAPDTLVSFSPPPSRTLPSLPLSLSPSLSLSSSLPPSPSPPPSSPSLFDSTWGCVCVGLACALMNAGALPALRRLSAWTGLVRAGRKRKNENTRRGILCRMFLLSFPPSPFPLPPFPLSPEIIRARRVDVIFTAECEPVGSARAGFIVSRMAQLLFRVTAGRLVGTTMTR